MDMKFNTIEHWAVVIKGTKKPLRKFRNKLTALNELPKLKKVYMDSLEVVRI